jgi:hypothetical protein
MSRSLRNLVVPLTAAGVLLLGACGSGAVAKPGAAPVDVHAAMAGLPGEHAHGIARDSGDGKVYLATHQGLFRYDKGTHAQVGPTVDFMGFSIVGPGHFYASGHPAPGVDLPQPAGLMESRDAGKTWSVVSRGGQSDFHALTSSSKGVMGYDGALMSTADGKAWQPLAIPAQPASLAAAPDGSRTLATTASGVMLSKNRGASWAPLTTAPQLLLAAWADQTTATGITNTGHLAVSTDSGETWKTGAGRVDSAQATSASRTSGGVLEVLVVTDSGIERTIDSGATFIPLGTS